jgi:prevent-host-death family protein
MTWQVQEAKQRFSELLRRAHDEGPQAVTRHGEEVAMVVDIAWYREVTGTTKDFAVFLGEMPHVDGLAEALDQNAVAAANDRGRQLWFDQDDIAAVEA